MTPEARRVLKAPFPWFGGKSRVAALVWTRFGDVANYVEPFFGAGHVLLGRPTEPRTETVNDLDGFVCNAWRAIAADPEGVAHHADWPVNENDLHARHAYLKPLRAELARRLEGDPAYYDSRIAGWWLWGIGMWIGGGWCFANGPWRVVDGLLVRVGGGGTKRARPELSNRKGVHTKVGGIRRVRPHLTSETGVHKGGSVSRKRPELDHGKGMHRGVKRQQPHIDGHGGRGVSQVHNADSLVEWMLALAARFRRVRVCCGDWSRVCGLTPTRCSKRQHTGVFLDPPYSETERDPALYADAFDPAAVWDWAVERGREPRMRIAICGYEGEHEMPPDWDCVAWKAGGGYGNQGKGQRGDRGKVNTGRERIWFSPACIRPSSARRVEANDHQF